MARLGDVCIINPKVPPIDDSMLVSFVPMQRVGEEGEFDPSEQRTYADVKKGFTYFADADVLFAKITPCMENGKGAIACGMENGIGFGSTEFHVLRPNKKMMMGEWLYYLTVCPTFRKEAERNMTGSAGQKRVPKSFLENYHVNIPVLSEQHQQVQVLNNIFALLSLRKQQLAKLDELVKSRFVEMFGDPVSNEREWNVETLNDVCTEIGDGLHGTPEYDDNGEYPFINGNNLINGAIEITPATKKVNAEIYKKHYIDISANALLLSINGTLGKLAFYNGEKVMLGKSACYCNFKPEINRAFVYGVMKTEAFAGFLEKSATASTIKNVGLKAIRGYKLIMPPQALQMQFIEFSNQADKSKLAVQQSIDQLETLKKSLMQKYFG